MLYDAYKPVLIAALQWARWAMPATAFVVDVLWVLNVSPQAELSSVRLWRRRHAATARVSEPTLTRRFYALLAGALVALERDRRAEQRARDDDPRPFGDHEAVVHNQEPRPETVLECAVAL